MKTIVVDDDHLSRKVIEEFIKKTESLSLVNSYSSAIDAINDLEKSKDDIDLIFLDVEMPDMSGMDFLAAMKKPPHIIIISAKENYALKAFEYDVTDYILKPISYTRFYKSVSKVIERDQNKDSKNSDNVSASEDEIFIKKKSAFIRLKYDEILYIEALENYVIVTTFNEKYTIHLTMKAIFDKLPEAKFKRIHRSYIINLNRINKIEDNQVVIDMKDGPKLLSIGKSYKDKLMKEINLITR